MALILAAWRLAADMSIAQEFAIGVGPFAHWQVWAGVAGVVTYLALVLQRYSRTGRFTG